MLAKNKSFSMNMGHEQATPLEARPNPRHAVLGLIHAVDQPRCRRVDQHGRQAAS